MPSRIATSNSAPGGIFLGAIQHTSPNVSRAVQNFSAMARSPVEKLMKTSFVMGIIWVGPGTPEVYPIPRVKSTSCRSTYPVLLVRLSRCTIAGTQAAFDDYLRDLRNVQGKSEPDGHLGVDGRWSCRPIPARPQGVFPQWRLGSCRPVCSHGFGVRRAARGLSIVVMQVPHLLARRQAPAIRGRVPRNRARPPTRAVPNVNIPVLLLGQFDAERLVEKPNLLDLASFQDQERQRNVGHVPASNARLRSCSTLPQPCLPDRSQASGGYNPPPYLDGSRPSRRNRPSRMVMGCGGQPGM